MTKTKTLLGLTALTMLAACAPVGDDGATGAVAQAAVTSALYDGSWGGNNEGGGIALTQLDADPRPEVVFLRADAPSGGNVGYYRVGWNVDLQTLPGSNETAYLPTSWGPSTSIPTAIGDRTSGAGVAMGDIDGNGRPEMVFVYVDDPSGEDKTYYRIGWNVSASGQVSSWSTPRAYTGGVHGHHTAGADASLRDLNNDGKLDLVVATVDNPDGENRISFSVGWGLSTAGWVTGGYASSSSVKSGWVGGSTSDLGIDLADMDGNGLLDIVVSWVDNPDGNDASYYQVGYDLVYPIGVRAWGPIRRFDNALGPTTQATGIAARDFDGDGSLDLMNFHLDATATGNVAHLSVLDDRSDRSLGFRFQSGQQCLDRGANQGVNGRSVSRDTCDPTLREQQWVVARNDNGYYNLISKLSGRCVQFNQYTDETAGFNPVFEWSCNGSASQEFSFVLPTSEGHQRLKNRASNRCVDQFTNAYLGYTVGMSTCSGSSATQVLELLPR